MKEIKVILASRPKILSEVLQYLIERQPDMKVIGKVLDPLELFLIIKIAGADVVIVTPLAGNGVPHICSELHAVYPLLIIVTHSAKGETAYLYQSGVRKRRIETPSAQAILEAIRKAMRKVPG